MKVIVAVRTRNEEKNIAQFCKSYTWADKIIIADGGSMDDTVDIAIRFRNVEVKPFYKTTELENGYTRNPHGEHLNFLIDWALQDGADWIIHDDCDCLPNKKVKDDFRTIASQTNKAFVYITRLYAYKNQGHFPSLAKPTGDYTPSLYAWRRDSGLRFKEGKQRSQAPENVPKKDDILYLMPPYALVHRAWPNDETINKKLSFYRESGLSTEMLHPLDFGGKLEPLPEWAIIEEL